MSKNINYHIKLLGVLMSELLVYLFILVAPEQAGPQSTTYEMTQYGFGSGGTNSNDSTTYSLFGITGEVTSATSSSTSYFNQPGLSYQLTAYTPPAPTFTNPSSYYNKLKIVINTGSNPTDTTFAIAISPDGFTATTQYVQADSTLGASPVWQTYTTWGGASGTTIIGLSGATTYTAKVAAKQGIFTQTPFSATAQAATINPTFSMSLSSTSLAFGALVPGSVQNTTTDLTVTVTTNAASGATIYAYDTNSGLSSSKGYTISSSTSDLAVATEGYGLKATTVTQSSGGPMEKVSPYAGSGSNVGILDTTKRPVFDSTSAPVTSGQGAFQLKAKASTVTAAASDYADTLTIIASGSF